MDSTTYRPGFDTQSCHYDPQLGSEESDQGLLSTINAPGRPHTLHHESNDRSSTTTTTTSFFGGLLDSPLVQIKQRNVDIPLSPPPTEPTTQSSLPPLTDTLNPTSGSLANIDDNNDDTAGEGKLGFGRPISTTESSPSTTSYSPPLSPVGTSPSFTSLSLSLSPITSRHRGESLVPTAPPPLASHDSIVEQSPDAKVLLSPLSPEWGADLVDEDNGSVPASIDAVLSAGKRGRAGRSAHGNDEDELDDLGLADDEDGANLFAFAGFLTRGSRPRLSMLEIPPSAFPPATLSPSSYFPSATSASTSSLWRVDETPTSPPKSSLWQVDGEPEPFAVARNEGTGIKHSPGDSATPTAPFAFFEDQGDRREKGENEDLFRRLQEPQPPSDTHHTSRFEHDHRTSPSVNTFDLFPSRYEDHGEDTFDAYYSPQLPSTSLPGLLSSPHVSFNDLPEDVYDEPTLLLSSNQDISYQGSPDKPLGLDFDAKSLLDSSNGLVIHTCNDAEFAKLSLLLEHLQAAEKDAKAKEAEALASIAALRSPGLSNSRSSPALPQTTTTPTSLHLVPSSAGASTSPSSQPSTIPPSTSIAELQRIAADARRAAKKARSRAKEISALLKFKLDERPSSDSLFSSSPTDPLLDSPSPPMLFEPLDDTTPTSLSVVSPPFPALQMDGFATSPPVFSSTNKSWSRKRKGCGGVDNLVARMILNRREAGSSGGTTAASNPVACANAKPVFLSPLLGQHHHQLQLQQRYKFLRSSPLARNVVTLPTSPRAVAPPTPLSSSLDLDSDESSSNGPSRSNSLDSTCSTDTACSSSSSSSSLWSDWDSDGETSFGEGDELPDLDDEEDEDAEMGFQALKTPLMWGLDDLGLGIDGGDSVIRDEREQVGAEGKGTAGGGSGGLLLPAL